MHPSSCQPSCRPSPAAAAACLPAADLPLQEPYGHGRHPSEWIDISPSWVACARDDPAQQRTVLRLLDMESGVCVKTSACPRPPLDEAEPPGERTGGCGGGWGGGLVGRRQGRA